MRQLLAVLAAAAVLALTGGAAAAHANYVKSNPAADARLAKSPTEIRVTFSEPPDPRNSDIAVLDPSGTRLDTRIVTAAPDEDDTLRVGVPALPDGGYLVSWAVVSIVDGHQTRGAFAFAIGSAALPGVPDLPSAPPPAPLELAGRLLCFAGVAITLGGSLFLLFIRRPVENDERRRARRLVWAGGSLLVLGSTLMLASYGTAVPSRLLLFLVARAGLGAAAIAVLLVGTLADESRHAATALLGLVAALTLTLVSHAAAGGTPLAVALDLIHVIAISIWSGGVLTLLIVTTPAAATDARALGATVWRFSLTALVAVAVIVTTGVVQSFDRLVLIWDLVETPYGIALLAKILLLVPLLGLGMLNLVVWGPRMRRGVPARAPLVRGVTAESILFVAVLGAAAYLTAAAPPAQRTAAAFDDTQRVDGVRVELLAASATTGRNRFVVRVHQGLAPVTDAEKVALRFTMVEHDMGVQELVASERAPGEYTTEGSPLSMYGTWHVETIVRIAGREDVHALFTVPITAPQGRGATAEVLTIAPYTVIVFSDPVRPQAGAPVTINIVLADATGDPVSGAKVVATFSGPSQRPPVQGVEKPSEAGPGHYAIVVPALAAGRWRIMITIDDNGSGKYELEVQK